MSQTILLTGASGDVARQLRPRLRARYGKLILSSRSPIADLAEGETHRAAALDDPEAVLAACEGVDGIVHLGGQSVEAPWETVDAANIQGMMNTLEAARRQGVKRLVFASSNHAVGMYPRNRRTGADQMARPDSRYGLSKVFGEAACALYADKHGLRCLSIRIGNVAEQPADRRRLSIWLHPDDLMQLCVIGLEHPDLHNAVVFGVSENDRSFWDNRAAFDLGYRPQHRAEDHVATALASQAKLASDPIGDALVGGGFASAEFDGDLERTLWS